MKRTNPSSCLSLSDVVKIWDAVSAHIESYMKQSKVKWLIQSYIFVLYILPLTRVWQYQVLEHLLSFINAPMWEIINTYYFNDLFLSSRIKLPKLMAWNLRAILSMVRYLFILWTIVFFKLNRLIHVIKLNNVSNMFYKSSIDRLPHNETWNLHFHASENCKSEIEKWKWDFSKILLRKSMEIVENNSITIRAM